MIPTPTEMINLKFVQIVGFYSQAQGIEKNYYLQERNHIDKF